MIVRATTERPVIFALTVLDRQIVDAGNAPPHQTFRVEFPILISVAAKPVTGVVVPFVCKAHSDPVLPERPHFLDQSVVELAIPFAREKRLDLRATMNEFGAISPDAVGRIGLRHAGRIARIPGILGKTRLLCGGFGSKRWQRWTTHGAGSFGAFNATIVN